MKVINCGLNFYVVTGNLDMVGSGVTDAKVGGLMTTVESVVVDGQELRINEKRRFSFSRYIGDYFQPDAVRAFFVDGHRVRGVKKLDGSVIWDEDGTEGLLKKKTYPWYGWVVLIGLCLTPLGFVLVPFTIFQFFLSNHVKKREIFKTQVLPAIENA